MKTALVKTESDGIESKITIRIVDAVNPDMDKQYLESWIIPEHNVKFVAIAVNEATDLFLNPFLFNYIKSLLT